MKKILQIPPIPSDTLIYNAALGVVIGGEENAYTWQCLQALKLRIREPEQMNFDDRLFIEYSGSLPFIDRRCLTQSEYSRVVDSEERVIGFLTEQLGMERYVYLFFDHYFVSGLAAYGKYHFVHDGLVYGFDDGRAQFYLLTYTDNHKFNSICVDYRQLAAAIRENHSDSCRMTVCTPQPYSFRLTPAALYEKLAVYGNLTSNADHGVSFNIGIYETLAEEIALTAREERLDYRTYKMLYEHYCCMKHILGELQSLLRDEDLTEELALIEDCITRSDILFKLIIKYNMTHSESVQGRIGASVRHLCEGERRLIGLLMPKLKLHMEESAHE